MKLRSGTQLVEEEGHPTWLGMPSRQLGSIEAADNIELAFEIY